MKWWGCLILILGFFQRSPPGFLLEFLSEFLKRFLYKCLLESENPFGIFIRDSFRIFFENSYTWGLYQGSSLVFPRFPLGITRFVFLPGFIHRYFAAFHQRFLYWTLPGSFTDSTDSNPSRGLYRFHQDSSLDFFRASFCNSLVDVSSFIGFPFMPKIHSDFFQGFFPQFLFRDFSWEFFSASGVPARFFQRSLLVIFQDFCR